MPGKSCGPCRASRRKDNPRQPAGRPRPLPPFGTGRNRLLQAGTRKQTGGRQTFPRGQTAQTDLPPLVMAESCILRLANA